MDKLNDTVSRYFFVMEQIETLQAEAEAIRDTLRSAMADQGTEEIDGDGWRATWHNTSIKRFDSAAFRKEYGDLYTAFCKPVSGTRFTLNQITA